MNKIFPKLARYADLVLTRKELIERNEKLFLLLEGFIFHSSLAVASTRIAGKADHPMVEIELSPLKRGLDGNFEVEVPLLTMTTEVSVGLEGYRVWPDQALDAPKH